MITQIPQLSRQNSENAAEHSGLNLAPLKHTALLYIREARDAENFEVMAEMIEAAREFGAVEAEIQHALRV